jgi:hypothetical protein
MTSGPIGFSSYKIGVERGIDVNNPANLDGDGYPLDIAKNNQAVLLPAFWRLIQVVTRRHWDFQKFPDT